MVTSVNLKCPCGSDLKYKKCCKLFHDGKIPKNALELMRSRYSAYALHVTSYIIDTTHKKNIDFNEDKVSWAHEIEDFSNQTRFVKLKVIDYKDGDIEAFVTFKASLFSVDFDTSFTETSKFIKEDGRWYYLSGKFV